MLLTKLSGGHCLLGGQRPPPNRLQEPCASRRVCAQCREGSRWRLVQRTDKATALTEPPWSPGPGKSSCLHWACAPLEPSTRPPAPRPFLGLSAVWASPEGAGKPFLPGQLPEEAEALAVCQFRMRQREDTKGFGGRAVTFESPCARALRLWQLLSSAQASLHCLTLGIINLTLQSIKSIK